MTWRSWVLGIVCGALLVGIAGAAPPTGTGTAAAPAPPPATVLPTPPGYKKAELACARNSDCVMDTDDNCCGGCGLSRPFAAISKRVLARRQRKLANLCARVDMNCDESQCSSGKEHTDPSCVTVPRCQKGRCVVVASASCLPATTGPGPTPPGNLVPPSCTTVSDCELAQSFTCCKDCGPSFPFRVLSKAAAAAERARSERACAVKDVDCIRHVCPSTPPIGCEAKVMCTNGTCGVRTTGRCPAPPAG